MSSHRRLLLFELFSVVIFTTYTISIVCESAAKKSIETTDERNEVDSNGEFNDEMDASIKLRAALKLIEATEEENDLDFDEDYAEPDENHELARIDIDIVPSTRERPKQRRERLAAAVCREVYNLNFCWNCHDRCDQLGPNQTRFHLANNEDQTAWHCKCEREFYDCLHRINSTLSAHIGGMYFDTHRRCFQNEYQISKCHEYDMSSIGTHYRCVRYVLRLGTSITNQWFDLPYYDGKPWRTPLFKTPNDV